VHRSLGTVGTRVTLIALAVGNFFWEKPAAARAETVATAQVLWCAVRSRAARVTIRLVVVPIPSAAVVLMVWIATVRTNRSFPANTPTRTATVLGCRIGGAGARAYIVGSADAVAVALTSIATRGCVVHPRGREAMSRGNQHSEEKNAAQHDTLKRVVQCRRVIGEKLKWSKCLY
jgi:hypothetical protein